jgi:hypothetical protein
MAAMRKLFSAFTLMAITYELFVTNISIWYSDHNTWRSAPDERSQLVEDFSTHYSVHTEPPPVFILSQMNPVHATQSNLDHFKINLPPTPRSCYLFFSLYPFQP